MNHLSEDGSTVVTTATRTWTTVWLVVVVDLKKPVRCQILTNPKPQILLEFN